MVCTLVLCYQRNRDLLSKLLVKDTYPLCLNRFYVVLSMKSVRTLTTINNNHPKLLGNKSLGIM